MSDVYDAALDRGAIGTVSLFRSTVDRCLVCGFAGSGGSSASGGGSGRPRATATSCASVQLDL